MPLRSSTRANSRRAMRSAVHDAIDAIQELRAEEPADLAHRVGRLRRRRRVATKPERHFAGHGGANVRGEHDDAAPEVRGATLRIREAAGVEHLQAEIEHVEVRLLDLVEQDHGERLLLHGGGQQPRPLARSDEPFERTERRELAHVETPQPPRVAEQQLGQAASQLGLADTGRPHEHQDTERLLRIGQPGLDQRDEIEHGIGCFALAHHAFGQRLAHTVQVQRDRIVEDPRRDAGGLPKRRQHVVLVELQRRLVPEAIQHAPQQRHGAARQRGPRREVIAQLHQTIERRRRSFRLRVLAH